MVIIHLLVHATVVLRPAPCVSVLATATLPLSFAFKKDGRPAARIIPSIYKAVEARRTIPALMKLAGSLMLFSSFFSISAASVLSYLGLRSVLACPYRLYFAKPSSSVAHLLSTI